MIMVKMMFIAVRLLAVKGLGLWGHRKQGVLCILLSDRAGLFRLDTVSASSTRCSTGA